MIPKLTKRLALFLSLVGLSACSTVNMSFDPVENGRFYVEYIQGTPTIGMCGFYRPGYHYGIEFLDNSGHYTPANLRVWDGQVKHQNSKVLNNIEGTVELMKSTSEVVVKLFEVDSYGRRNPLVINGRHKYQEKPL